MLGQELSRRRCVSGARPIKLALMLEPPRYRVLGDALSAVDLDLLALISVGTNSDILSIDLCECSGRPTAFFIGWEKLALAGGTSVRHRATRSRPGGGGVPGTISGFDATNFRHRSRRYRKSHRDRYIQQRSVVDHDAHGHSAKVTIARGHRPARPRLLQRHCRRLGRGGGKGGATGKPSFDRGNAWRMKDFNHWGSGHDPATIRKPEENKP